MNIVSVLPLIYFACSTDQHDFDHVDAYELVLETP